MWKCLDHPNIVAFKGVTLNPLQLVSEWMPGGELRQYLMKYPDADRINLVGSNPTHFHMTPHFRSQLLGVAEGLAYLHSCGVVHGDLKGVRVITNIGISFSTGSTTAEHRGGRVWKCTNHGLWSYKHRPGSKFGREHWLLAPVDCT